MTNRLRDKPADFNALVSATARATRIDPAFVEKDYWVTEVLRAACVDRVIRRTDGTDDSVSFVFKGGTSLSRVFGIIERFSEDVDMLAVFPENCSETARHKVLKQVDTDAKAATGIVSSSVRSTTGVKRDTSDPYEAQFGAQTLRDNGVLLELGSRGGPYPASWHVFPR